MTRDELTLVLAFLAEVYPNSKPPANVEDRLDAWMVVLGDEDGPGMMAGARLVARQDHFYPTPARLLDGALAARCGRNEIPDKFGLVALRHLERRGGDVEAYDRALVRVFHRRGRDDRD